MTRPDAYGHARPTPTVLRGSNARLVGIVTCAAALGWAVAGARDVPLSPHHGNARVGPDWPDRHGLRGERVAGEMASLDAYERPGFDPEAVHPDVRALYERTSDFEMTLTAAWHRPFRLGARLASCWTSRVEQLNLPEPGGDPKRVTSDLFALSPVGAAADPRDDPRLWIRTTEDGEGVFVAVYASHVADGERVVNVAVPLPGASLATVLRMENHGTGVALTTDCPDGGLYLHTDAGAVRLPASQRFGVAPAGDPDAPAPPDADGIADAAVFADQRIRLCGCPLVTVRYAATRA
ncbi:hypothetical protein SAMN04488065_0792 [Haloplanus vescus]|uniref:Uncharacterized protein n=1 Tax=Haloplanus vescus TaxID=555874 RepID=A0A1H3WE46_9EURY|nr:hypothetical protein SAMN04488065_0792 [Haloplanus vescus]